MLWCRSSEQRSHGLELSLWKATTVTGEDDGAVSTLSGSMEQLELPMPKRVMLQNFVAFQVFPVAPLLNRQTYDRYEDMALLLADWVKPCNGPEFSVSRRKWTLEKVQQMRHNGKTAVRNAIRSKCGVFVGTERSLLFVYRLTHPAPLGLLFVIAQRGGTRKRSLTSLQRCWQSCDAVATMMRIQ